MPNSSGTSLRVVIVHDWLIGGGAELVVEQLHKLYPDAPIYTSCATREWREKLGGKVITGPLQWWPFFKLRKFIPVLRIWWFQSLKLDDYDLVISSSGAEAKGVKTRGKTIHINYCHAPTHYYWSRYDEYLKNPGFGVFNWLARVGLMALVGPLKKWDYTAAQRPNQIIANSTHTKDQIKKYYDRESTVIHPPVNIERFKHAAIDRKDRSGYVITGRQTPYKRIDLAIKACTELNLPLTVIGNGPEHKRLQKLAGGSITFVSNATNQQVAKYVGSSEAFIFPGIDDFGIAAVEALAAGTPVIAYRGGGALDYVVPGKTGEFFKVQTSESLQKILGKFDNAKYSSDDIQSFAEQFSIDQFLKNIRAHVKNVL